MPPTAVKRIQQRHAVISPHWPPSLLKLNDVVTNLPVRFEDVRVRRLTGANSNGGEMRGYAAEQALVF